MGAEHESYLRAKDNCDLRFPSHRQLFRPREIQFDLAVDDSPLEILEVTDCS
jgi:hypothetical protein